MRNWNLKRSAHHLTVFLFSAYLWGIETQWSKVDNSATARFSAYLWGIETPEDWSIYGPEGNVFSLPMRNWNQGTVWWSSFPFPFSAYLWGIETHHGFSFSSFHHGFQLTYEELKPYTTTRGLPVNREFSAYLWGIETDLFQGRSADGSLVFSLPMRNWNHW